MKRLYLLGNNCIPLHLDVVFRYFTTCLWITLLSFSLSCEWVDPTLKTLKTCSLPTSVSTIGIKGTTYTYGLVTSAPADIKSVTWQVLNGSTSLTKAERTDTTAFSHTYATSGTYTVNAEIETVCGEKLTRTIATTTTIKTCVLPSAITSTTVSSAMYRFKLATTAPNDVKTILWKVTDAGTTLAQEQRTDTTTFVYTFSAAGTYAISADIESVCGEKITLTYSASVDPGIPATASFAAWKIGGSGQEIGRSVAVDISGNAYIVGTYGSPFTFAGINIAVEGRKDAFIAKYNSRGDAVWVQRITGSAVEEINDIKITDTGDIYVTGEVSPNAGYYNTTDDVRLDKVVRRTVSGNGDVFLAKYNRDGNLGWFRTFGALSSESGSSLALHPSGIYLTGVFGAASTTFGAIQLSALGTDGKYDMFLAKFSYNGDPQWAVSCGGFESDFASSVAVDTDGSVFMSGSFESPGTFRSFSGGSASYSSNVSPDIFIAKYSTSGNLLAFHRASSGNFVYANSLVISQGALYATGIIGGARYGNLTVDYQGGNGDIFIAKYNLSTLNVEWVKTAGSPGFDAGNKIALDEAGNLYLAGLLNDNCKFGTSTIRSAGGTDAFLACYDANGNFRFAKSIGGATDDGYNGLAVNKSGTLVHMTGFFGGTLKAGNTSLSSAGDLDVLTTRYPD